MRKQRNKFFNQVFENVEILTAGAEGNSIAKVDGRVIFVKNAAPGDIVDLRVVGKKKKFLNAEVEKIHKGSPVRVEPFCEHFGTCGGCKWQHMDYAAQLKYKQQQVVDAFTRIAKVEIPEIEPILGSKETRYYRNKLEYTFSNRRWVDSKTDYDAQNQNTLGYHVPGRFDKVLDVKHCYLQADPSNEIRLAIKQYADEHEFTFFDLKYQEGFLRTLILRSTSINEWMVIVTFFHEDKEKREGLLNFLAEKFPQITSLNYVINEKGNDTIADQEVVLFKGKEYIEEEMEGLRFKIRPKSFFQTNTVQAYELYKVARDFAGLTGEELVYDLYTGTGTIALFVAKQAKKVVGVEYIQQAIDDAFDNAKENGIEHADFFAGDMKRVLTDEFIAKNGKPDVIITDPPRAGMDADVIKKILEIAPEKVVYVSCNPATQARDVALMDEFYKVEQLQPVDMFPHTHHVENVALLVKR